MPQQRTDNLEWVSLTDFTPGIWNRTGNALGGINAGVAIPAPLGAAQETGTYRCVALPGGGLGPLPKRIQTFTIAAPEGSAPDSGYWIVGFLIFGPVSTGPGGVSRYADQALVTVAYRSAGSNVQVCRVFRQQLFSAAIVTDSLVGVTSTSTVGSNWYETSWFTPDRMNASDPTLPGQPVIAFSWRDPSATTSFIKTFPDPSTANVTGVMDLSTRYGQVIGHQGRITLLEPVPYAMGAVGGTFTDEQISFTDPPNSVTLGNQQEVFAQEWPTGVGAVGSISAGEFFMVKRQGGGVIVSGDLANPSVTRLPGVTGTGTATTNRTASTSVGLAYAVKDGGLHLWRGGDTSTKISANLDDDAFECPGAPPRQDSQGLTNQPVVSVAEWGNFIVCTNNWLFDTTTSGWWKLENSASVNCMYFSRSYTNQFMFGALPQFTQTNTNAFYAWDRNQPATSWAWQSHPIPATIDRLTEVREMVLVAQGTGTVTLTLTGIDPAGNDATQAETFTITHTSQPQRLRPAAGGTFMKGYNVIVQIASSGTDAAPVVYAVHLGTRQSQQATTS